MVNRNLIRSLEDDEITNVVSDIDDEIMQMYASVEGEQEYDVNKIVTGKIIRVDDDSVLVDVGFKSEGTISLSEWTREEPPLPLPEVGDEIDVLIEEIEDDLGQADDPHGMVRLSYTKARRIRQFEAVTKSLDEGAVVTGEVVRKIKGGLLVDIGVPVFLPASQVDIRRPPDIGDYIGQTVKCDVLKIDHARRNIVVSRRSMIERERELEREELLKVLEIGQIRKGVVKNIAEFGAFVDLGGIDGLLHITDMSWERIGHPSEMVAIDEEIEVMVLNIDHEKKKIALGLKQKQDNPWDNVIEKYPEGSKVKGSVVNVMSYGAFVKLEPGIEGLVHISEMSWTKRVNHPNELVQIGDEIDVVILNVDAKEQQLSLGMKQAEENPWTTVGDRYPVDSVIKGRVRNLTNYGAFIELEEGIDGLLHVSDMSWTRKISHPSELLEKGQEIECKILSVDQERRRIALGLKQLDNDPWAHDIPTKYQPNQVVHGKVTKITNFGVFVGLEDGLEGLLHISELADHKVENPEDVVSVGDEIEVKILRVDTDDRKIGLSRRRVEWAEEDEAAAADSGGGGDKQSRRASPQNLKGGLGESGPLISPNLAADSSEDADEADSGEADSGEADSGEADSGEADSGEADSGEADSGEADSGEADSGEADGAEADAPEASDTADSAEPSDDA